MATQCYHDCTVILEMTKTATSQSIIDYLPESEKKCSADQVKICRDTCNYFEVSGTAEITTSQEESFEVQLRIKHFYCGDSGEGSQQVTDEVCDASWDAGIVASLAGDQLNYIDMTCGVISACQMQCGVDAEDLIVTKKKQCFNGYQITDMAGATSNQISQLTAAEKKISLGTVYICEEDEDCFYLTISGTAIVITREDLQSIPITEESVISITAAQCLPAETTTELVSTGQVCETWHARVEDGFLGNEMLSNKVSDVHITCDSVAVCNGAECVSPDELVSAAVGITRLFNVIHVLIVFTLIFMM